MEPNNELKALLNSKQNCPVAIISDGLFIFANENFLSLLGYPSVEAISAIPFLDLCANINPVHLKKFFKGAKGRATTQKTYQPLAVELLTNSGESLECQVSATRLDIDEENALLIELSVTEASDITSSKLEALWNNPEPAAIVLDGIIAAANQPFADRLGYDSADSLSGQTLLDLPLGIDNWAMKVYLKQASLVAEDAPTGTELEVTLDTPETAVNRVLLQGRRTDYQGEPGVLINLKVIEVPGIFKRVIQRPWKLYLSLLMLAILTILPNAFLPNLNINNAPKVYLPQDAPAVVVDDKLREQFPSDQSIVLLFEGVALFSDGFLTALGALTDELAGNPAIEKVVSVTSQDHIRGTEDGFIVEPLINLDELELAEESSRRTYALSDPFANKLLVAKDGSALSVVVFPSPINSSFQRMALQDEILASVDKHQLTGYLSAVAGQITTDVEQTRSLLLENMKFIPATVGIGLLLIWLLFKRKLAVLVGGFVIGSVVSSTVAFYVVLQQPFNMISSILPPLLSALTIAALVHLFNALYFESRRGFSGEERVSRALKEIRKPALYNCLTTSAGFASLGLSTIPPIQVFGLITAAGVILIYLVVYHLAPNIFIRFDKQFWPAKKGTRGLMDTIVGLCFHFALRRPLVAILATLILVAAALPQALNLHVETNLLEFFAKDHKTRIATEHIQEKLVGISALDIVFTSSGDDQLTSSSNLNAIAEFQEWADQQKEIDKTLSLADFVKEMHWGFHGEDNEFRKIPEDDDLISQYLFIYDGNDLYDFVDENFEVTRVSLSVNVHGANEISELMDRIRDYLAIHNKAGLTLEIAGTGRMFADQEDLLVSGQVKSLSGALILIFVLMLLLWRSLKDSLICMIPNLSPILLIFSLMGIFNIWLDMATAMIASVAVGIAVDDTIHIYHGFIHRVRAGIKPVIAIARTYRQAGRAVTTTTVILCSQFLILTTGNFVPIVNFGLLTSVGLLAALFFDLLFLPALLILITGHSKQKS